MSGQTAFSRAPYYTPAGALRPQKSAHAVNFPTHPAAVRGPLSYDTPANQPHRAQGGQNERRRLRHRHKHLDTVVAVVADIDVTGCVNGDSLQAWRGRCQEGRRIPWVGAPRLGRPIGETTPAAKNQRKSVTNQPAHPPLGQVAALCRLWRVRPESGPPPMTPGKAAGMQ